MKVLVIPSWYPTAEAPLLGSFYKEETEALAARGVETAVAYVTVDGDLNPAHHGIRRSVENGVFTITYSRPNLTPRVEKGRCLQRTRMLRKLYRHIEAEWGRPDVVNLRSSLQGYEALDLCRREGLPLFFMEHSSYVMTEGEGSEARRRLFTVMDHAAVNACVSHALHAVMAPHGETRIIPDFVDESRFYPIDVKRDDEAAPAFVFRAMGQLRPIKGYDTLIRAFTRLRELTDRPVRLDIAGAGPLQGTLADLIVQCGVQESCHLVGTVPRDKTVYYMNGCDCFVCSSRLETLSCVLQEAAACGKPVIATACGGPADIVTADNGLIVPVSDPEAMAQAMRRMLDSADRYDPERIREDVLERFGMESVCQRLIEACRDASAAPPVR